MTTILILTGAGFLLLLTEMFLPGGVLGIFGALLLLAAVILGYMQNGPVWGSLLLCVILAGVLVGFCVGMAVFPRTPIGRRMTLGSVLSSGDVLASPSAVPGSEGIAITPLRPAGKALIGDRRVDVVAESELIEPDTAIVVITVEGARIVVRRKA